MMFKEVGFLTERHLAVCVILLFPRVDRLYSAWPSAAKRVLRRQAEQTAPLPNFLGRGKGRAQRPEYRGSPRAISRTEGGILREP